MRQQVEDLKIYLVGVIIAACMLALPFTVRADDALLYLAPPSAVITIGETFTISVMIDTGGDTINAAEGAVAIPTDDLEVVSINTNTSIFESWLTQPQLEGDQIRFSGATGQAGYNGDSGTIMSLTLRALRNTNSQVWFSQGAAVLAADGQASNILSQLRSGTYSLTSREVVPALSSVTQTDGGGEAASVGGETNASEGKNIISSITHPNEDKWYATGTARLRWNINDSITGVRTALTSEPDSKPTKVYNTPISQITLEDLDEGTSYFHLQLRDDGGWDTIYHFAINVDSEDPHSLKVKEVTRDDETDPEVAFTVQATDDLSGIDHYEFVIDGGKPIIWGDTDESGIFKPENVKPGSHSMKVRARDGAGNYAEEQVNFLIEALDPPIITESPDRLLAGEPLTIRGETYPNAEVESFVAYDGGEPKKRTITSDATGEFVITAVESARSGQYDIWFETTDRRGARSNASEHVVINAEQPKFFLFGGSINYFTLVLTFLGVIVGLGLLVWLMWYLFRRMKGRVHKETYEAESVVHESFLQMKTDIRNHINMLLDAGSKRSLTQEEEHMLAELSQRLDEMEYAITDEIQDIDETVQYTPPRQHEQSQTLNLKRVR